MATQVPLRQAAPRFRLVLLGPFAVYRDGIPIDTSAWQPAVGTLLKLLATAPNWRRSRDELMDTLWPDASPEAAASNLRSKLHFLRRDLGGGDPWPILFTRGWIELNRAYAWEIDLDRFEELMRTAGEDVERLVDAVSLYQGEPLPEDRYQDWALPVRERARRLWREGMLRLAADHEERKNYEAALDRLEILLRDDPLDEDALRALVRLLTMTGRRTEAMRRYRQFEQRLRTELELSPTAETAAVVAGIKELNGEAAEATRSAPDRTARPPTNLRHELTSFVGREHEVKTIVRLLQRPEIRLVTLTGVGGTGKSRLALRVAASLLPTFRDGVFFVALDRLKDPDLVVPTINAALGVKEIPGRSQRAALEAHLQDKQLLLLLDNFEHLLDAASVVVELAEQCAGLHVLVTSRAPLQVYGEHEYPVPPLAVPNPARLPNLEVLAHIEGVALFLERARAVKPDFDLTEESAPAIAAICHRLEGLPLAIELAAARIKHFSPQELLERVERRLPFLAGGPRNRPERLQSVRGMIDWSYGLLDEPEQRSFNCMSVFTGGCMFEAARAVCGAMDRAVADLPQHLASLVDKNLLVEEQCDVPEPGPQRRFSMLETVREYGLERLVSSGEADDLRRRHAAYFLALAERSDSGLQGPDQAAWMAYLDHEYGNLRQGLQWALEHQNIEFGLRLATSLIRYWSYGDHFEGQSWFDRLLLPAAEGGDAARLAPLRAKALFGASRLANWQGAGDRAEELAAESLALYRELGDEAGTAEALSVLASVAIDRNDCGRAATLLEESLSLVRELADTRGIAYRLNQLGLIAARQVDCERAVSLFRSSLAIYRQLGDTFHIALTLAHLAEVTLYQGDGTDVRPEIEESLRLRREMGDTWGIAESIGLLAMAARADGDFEHAERLAEDSLMLFREVGRPLGINWCIEILARTLLDRGELERAAVLYQEGLLLSRNGDDKLGLAYALEGVGTLLESRGKVEHAARLYGVAAALRNRCNAPIRPFERASYERSLASIRGALGDHAFARTWNEGQAMALDEAIACALEN